MHYKKIFMVFILTQHSFGTEEELSFSSKHALSPLAPKGHWAIQIEAKNRTTNFSYNNAKKKSSIGSKYNNIDINKDIFPSLALFGEGASLGKTSAEMEIVSNYFEFALGYGITKDLTVGIIVPYREKKTTLNFSLQNGNLGINPNFNSTAPTTARNSPYLPSSIEGINPMTTTQLQSVLASRSLDLEYKPLQTTKNSGLADPTLGLLWNVYSSKNSSLILGTGFRFGIAEEDDPDNLLATDIGDGNSGIRLKAEYYQDLTNGFDLYTQIEYGIELEDKVTKRVPKDGVFLANKSSTEKLTRDLGDYRIYDIGVGKSWGDYRFSAGWHRAEKDKDSYASSKGTNISVLEANTDSYANQWETSISWSGIDAWSKGNIPLPLILTLNYRDTYEAKNAYAWKEVYLGLTSFF